MAVWSRLFGAIFGLIFLCGGLWFGLSREAAFFSSETTGLDGTTSTREYRKPRWWERLFMLPVVALGGYVLVVSVAPDSSIAPSAKRAFALVLALLETAGTGTTLAAAAAWLFWRRVLGHERSPKRKATETRQASVVQVTESPAEQPDFVGEALAGEGAEWAFGRLVRVMASGPKSAFVLAAACVIAAYYLFAKVPAAFHREFDVAMGPVSAWDLVAGAADAVAFLLLPLAACVILVVSIVQGSWKDVPFALVALCILAIIALVSWKTGFLGPLFELVAKFR